MALAYATRDKLVHAILTDKRLSLLGIKARESKFAEMRTKTATEISNYINEVEKLNAPKPLVVRDTPSLRDLLSRLLK
jgi:hypothetical protein